MNCSQLQMDCARQTAERLCFFSILCAESKCRKTGDQIQINKSSTHVPLRSEHELTFSSQLH